ncbi:hypothetical protein D3C77_671270 [compost metagenome]
MTALAFTHQDLGTAHDDNAYAHTDILLNVRHTHIRLLNHCYVLLMTDASNTPLQTRPCTLIPREFFATNVVR